MSLKADVEPPLPDAIRVVVVEDSHFMRTLLCSVLNADARINVVATASNPFEARQRIRETSPDVITLDIHMPQMDGVEFLRRIMKLRPMPVVMVTGQALSQANLALKTLEIGAVGLVPKPSGKNGWTRFSNQLRETVRTAALARVDGFKAVPTRTAVVPASCVSDRSVGARRPRCQLIAIGASTGGVTAITRLLAGLTTPESTPPIVIAQHMPAGFTTSFARRLARAGGKDVAEAQHGDILGPGMVRIAPGGLHLRVVREAGRLVCAVTDEAPVNNHRPSVDTLFSSVSQALGRQAIGVILTGMGSDGMRGLLQMRAAGAHTLGQTESSCTIYGMPAAAKSVGAVVLELDIDQMASHVRLRLHP